MTQFEALRLPLRPDQTLETNPRIRVLTILATPLTTNVETLALQNNILTQLEGLAGVTSDFAQDRPLLTTIRTIARSEDETYDFLDAQKSTMTSTLRRESLARFMNATSLFNELAHGTITTRGRDNMLAFIDFVCNQDVFVQQDMYLLETFANHTTPFADATDPTIYESPADILRSYIANHPEVREKIDTYVTDTSFPTPLEGMLEPVTPSLKTALLDQIPHISMQATEENFSQHILTSDSPDLPLQIVRYLVARPTITIARSSDQVLTGLVLSALEHRPDIFTINSSPALSSSLRAELIQFFTAKRASDIFPVQDNPYIAGEKRKFSEKLKHHGSLTIETPYPLGDSILLMPYLTSVIEQLDPTAPIRIIVPGTVVPFATAVFEKFPQVTIYTKSDTIPASDAVLLYAEPSEKRGVLIPAAVGSVELTYNLPLEPASLENQTATTMYQQELANIFPVDLTHMDHQRVVTDMRAATEQYARTYIEQEKPAGILDVASAFPQGYVCIGIRGSDQGKVLPPSFIEHTIEAVAKKGLGVLIVDTEDKGNTIYPVEPNQAADYQRRYGVPVQVVNLANTTHIGVVMHYMEKAKGYIGPDTFLTHLAEYFTMPVMNVLSNSLVEIFRTNTDVIPVNHPLVEQLRRELLAAQYSMTERYMELANRHPLDITPAANVLVEQAQSVLRERQDKGLDRFLQQVA